MNTEPQDTPFSRQHIGEMTDDQLEAWINQLRTRRTRSYEIYQAAQRAKQEALDEKNKALLQKQLDMFARKLESVDKGLDALAARAQKIREVRLEIGVPDI